MARYRLFRLNTGDKFTWNGIEYTVTSHSERMTEVSGNGRLWAWPSSVLVNIVDKPNK